MSLESTDVRPASRKRPRIAVTGPDRGGGPMWIATAIAVLVAGGRPVRITPGSPRGLRRMDGLILGGGADVDPLLYAAESFAAVAAESAEAGSASRRLRWLTLPSLLLAPIIWIARRVSGVGVTAGVDKPRDRLERQLLQEAMRDGKPVLGICRGAQLINVTLGGTLHQDIADYYVETPQVRSVLPRKRVRVSPGSRLSQLCGCRQLTVNALHRQAVATPGTGVRIVGREPNGVAQAIEVDGKSFLLGVQWHPEFLPQMRTQRVLFEALVHAALQPLAVDGG